MTTPLRPLRPPRLVTGCWAVSVVSGAALLAAGPTPAPVRTEVPSAALRPATVTDHLRRAAGTDARDLRINNVYGSGHSGAWQFVAHLTWRDNTGDVVGGTTTLPQLAGQAPLDSDLSHDRLGREQDIGWTLEAADAVLDRLPDTDRPLAMLDLEIRPDGGSEITACHAQGEGPASCATWDRAGKQSGPFGDDLTDQPLLDALSVQRASKPIG